MKILLLLVLTSVLAADKDLQVEEKISSGTSGRWGQIPCYTAMSISIQDSTVLCSGCLISARKVLTSAHCVTSQTGATADRISFSFGLWRIVRRDITMVDLKIHPNFNPRMRNSTADIAVITLNKDVAVSRFLGPAVPSKNSTPNAYVGQMLFVCGFGVINNELQSPWLLQCTYLRAIPVANCNSWGAASSSSTTTLAGSTTTSAATTTTTTAAVTTTAGSTTTGSSTSSGGTICIRNIDDSNICDGDEGSPVFSNRTGALEYVGIISYSPDVRNNARCLDGHTVVATQLGSYSDFITSALSV